MRYFSRTLPALGLAIIVTMLSGCSLLGLQGPQTFKQRADTAIKSVQAVRQTAITLVDADRITPDRAEEIQQEANSLRAGIDLARELHATSPAEGDAKLTAIILALQALKTELKSRESQSNANEPEQPANRRPAGARLLHPRPAIPGADVSHAFGGA